MGCDYGGAWRVLAPRRKAQILALTPEGWFRPRGSSLVSRFCEAQLCPLVGGFLTSLKFQGRGILSLLGGLSGWSSARNVEPEAQRGRSRLAGVQLGSDTPGRAQLASVLSSVLFFCLLSPLLPHSLLLPLLGMRGGTSFQAEPPTVSLTGNSLLVRNAECPQDL